LPQIGTWFHQAIVKYSRIATCTAGYWIRWSRWTAYSSSGYASFLNCHSFVIPYFLSIFHQCYFSWSKWIVCNRPAHMNIAFIRKPVSTYVVSTDVAGVGTTYDVTRGGIPVIIVVQPRLRRKKPTLQMVSRINTQRTPWSETRVFSDKVWLILTGIANRRNKRFWYFERYHFVHCD
jgi:hypothetical protein